MGPHFMLLLSTYVLYSNVTYISCIMSCVNKIVSNCFKNCFKSYFKLFHYTSCSGQRIIHRAHNSPMIMSSHVFMYVLKRSVSAKNAGHLVVCTTKVSNTICIVCMCVFYYCVLKNRYHLCGWTYTNNDVRNHLCGWTYTVLAQRVIVTCPTARM